MFKTLETVVLFTLIVVVVVVLAQNAPKVADALAGKLSAVAQTR